MVWPKARQLNLIAKILNNICNGVGIKLSLPTIPSPSHPVTISIDEEWLADKIGSAGAGVKSVNGEDGALTVNGGKNIRVYTADKVITISYDEGKDPDEGAVMPEDEPDCNDWTGGENGNGEPGGAEWGDDDGGVSDAAAWKKSPNGWSDDQPDISGNGGADGGGGGGGDGDGNGWAGDSCAELNGWQ